MYLKFVNGLIKNQYPLPSTPKNKTENKVLSKRTATKAMMAQIMNTF